MQLIIAGIGTLLELTIYFHSALFRLVNIFEIYGKMHIFIRVYTDNKNDNNNNNMNM